MSDKGMSLSGNRVVVIGGATGVGFAVADLARAQGAEVVVASRNEAKIHAAVERLGSATGRTVDLRDEAQVADFFGALGSYDHLVITAGDWDLPMFGTLSDLDLGQARELLTVRFWGVLAAAKYGAKSIAAGGSITLTGGMLAHRPGKGTVMATTMAGAIEFLARGLAMDLAPVRVNAVCLGLILTEIIKQRPEAALRAMVAPLPVPRAASPTEAAKAYVYLMTNAYVTGQILPVDGGGMLV